ncbi:Prophage minor tail protein Z (GPZ) [Syntrophus gentianae]|uniref:Prophage minor tail protein Z (GPZ) n=1 Tax=Syntrophus gentianae TaxID=43775 RepID=A0A1H8AZD4_9BACT|nr:phage tail protein [Syntrophus gentianae]SEM75168.1 Prophage minor tail protein Z (GPZ) [Syntrophus gentianae]
MIRISIDPIDQARVRNILSGMKNMGERVLSRSLNKTITGVKTDASTEIRQELNAKKAAVDETFTLNKATIKKLSASIVSTGKPLALIDFVGTRQTNKGVSVLVKKTGARKIIPGAFIATMKEGHKGVFWRNWHGVKRTKSTKIKYGALPKKYRLPMSERFGPRVPDILGNDSVMGTVLKKASDRLHTNIESELNYELGKLK